MHKSPKTGLVLSGGGAKGAYQVGVIRALVEANVQVDMISGASIGALNGGILAGAGPLSKGLERLDTLWSTLAKATPLKINPMMYVQLLVAAGAMVMPQARVLMAILGLKSSSVLSDTRLQELMDEYLNVEGLGKGVPLYVSVYKTLGAVIDLQRCLSAAAGLKDTPPSEFIHLQSLAKEEQRNALMASAALPMLFEARKVRGDLYTDGSQGGWSTAQGNTPIQPLVDNGCLLVLVTHLSNGSLWNRHDFPDVAVLDIRPKTSMARGTGPFGGVKDLLGFDVSKIQSWIDQGYEDTMRSLNEAKAIISSHKTLSDSKQKLAESEQRLDQASARRKEIMSKLRGSR